MSARGDPAPLRLPGRAAAALHQLGAVSDLLGERMPEGAKARSVGRAEKLGGAEPCERRLELGLGHPHGNAEQLG